MAWQPQPQGLDELVQCLRSSSASDTVVQQQVQKRLESFNEIPDYPCYLVHILTALPGEQDTTRTMAGLILKNNIRMRFRSLQPGVLDHVKAHIFTALQDPSPTIRNTAGTVIDTLLTSLEPENWPEALSKLLELADSPDQKTQEGAFGALDKLCQDMSKKLEQLDIGGTRPLDYMVPKFLEHMDSPAEKVRMHAISCAIQFISAETNSLSVHLDTFLSLLFKHASDASAEVRKLVCQALVQLLASRPDMLAPHMDNVVAFMLYSTKDGNDESVALEACEFWLTFAEDTDLVEHLRPYLPRVVPVLLHSMHYSDMDLMYLDTDDEDDANVPDRPEDIKPHILGSKAHTNERVEESANGTTTKGRGDLQGAEDDEDDYDDEFDEEDEIYTEWNLRKCAAAALDVMACTYAQDMMVVLLPYLKEKLMSEDWLDRESGILALGAIAEGCIDAIEPDLPVLMPFLINSLADAKPLVRSISCWTIGRYSSWTVKEDASPEHRQEFFVKTLEGLLKACLDNNKRVQEAGCSAFATLEEEAGEELQPYLGSILSNLVFAFGKYQRKNLLILYDAIGTLADAVGSALNKSEYIEILMPPLIQRWSALEDQDNDLIPLLECMSSVVIALGAGFGPYAQPVFERCVRIAHQSLLDLQNYRSNPAEFEEPDKTFLIVSLDLLSGLTQGLGADIVPLYQSSRPPLLEILGMCLQQHPDMPVRQSAYALLGDTAISCFSVLRPVLSELMPGLISHIEVEPRADSVSVCNNAAWAAGEIALQAGAEMEPWVAPLMERLVPVLMSPKSARSLMENSAVTIGRLACVCPQTVAPHLQVFVGAWCTALADIKDNDEKDSAFQGICAAIQVNPNGLSSAFGHFLNAVARWSRPSDRLNDMFKNILVAFKGMIDPAAWEAQLNQLPPEITTRLRSRYPI